MVQKTYEVTVEAVVQRTVIVEAANADEADILGCQEVKGLLGALSTEMYQLRRIDDVN